MSTHTILIVDDNEDNVELLEEALADRPVKILRARSGPDAISVLMSHAVDLVLLDIEMPDMNGFAVLELIRGIPRLMKRSVILQTAHGSSFNITRAKDLGVRVVLHKPISLEELKRHVDAYLSEHQPA